MKTTHYSTIGIALALLLTAASPLRAADTPGVPAFIDYKGRVLDANGAPLATSAPTNYEVQFRIYDAPTGGTVVWAEKQLVTVYNGQFSVRLGRGDAILAAGGAEEGTVGHTSPGLPAAFAGQERHLGVTVVITGQTPAEISPRLAFLTSPFSFNAARAGTLSQAPGTKSDLTVGSIAYATQVLSTSAALSGENHTVLADSTTFTVTATLPQSGAQKEITIAKTDSSANPVVVAPPAGGTINGSNASLTLALKGDSVTLQNTGGNNWWIVNDNRKLINLSLTSLTASGAVTAGSLSIPGLTVASGNVGIGTTTPLSKLHVSGTAAKIILGSPDSAALDTTLEFRSGWSSLANADDVTGWVGGSPDSDSGGKLLFCTSATNGNVIERMRINASGNVGIGTDNPLSRLMVTGPNTSSGDGQLYVTADDVSERLIIGVNSTGNGKATIQATKSNVENTPLLLNPYGGNVGIGTENPTQAKLVVNGTSSASGVHTYPAWLNASGAVGSNFSLGSYNLYSIYATGRIAAVEFNAMSDERIKTIHGVSNGRKDLATLQSIQITDYTYRDPIKYGSGEKKKVIAQQIEKVYPQAVSKSKDVIPDILKKATCKAGWIELVAPVKPGDRLRLITESDEQMVEVSEVNEQSRRFRTNEQVADGDVIVYGREVNDFRNVDYEAISMLNVSATQQLKKEKDALETETIQLRAKVAAQDKRLAELETEAKDREARLVAIEKALLGKDAPAARTVSLKGQTAAK
ncbi:MAG: tail fiber domain-containing protein [Roseimicrobium sp.]